MTYNMPLNELLSVFAIESDLEQQVDSITLDSRSVKPGSVFFACKGHATDGRDYILSAQQAGALAIVYEATGAPTLPNDVNVPTFAVQGLGDMVGYAASVFYREPSQELQVFGVTGTNGKTTCCYLLVQALSALGMNAAMIGTIGVGRLNELNNASLTTPDPIAVHAALAEFRDQGVTQVAMEVSSHALDQGRVNGVAFFCTLFTNLSHDHLDYHGDMATYAATKQRLFTEFHSQLVITNAADDLGARLIDVANADFIVQYGKGGDVFADEVELGAKGIRLLIEGNGVEFDVNTPLIGEVNVPNLEMLIATLLALSTSVEDIQNIVANLKAAPGRMELYTATSKPNVVIDYAHTPDALKKALLSVAKHCDEQLWCVFGCGGDRDSAKRAEMGKLAMSYAHHCVITNDNPRTEDPQLIARQIEAGMQIVTEQNNDDHESEYRIVLDRADAIRHAINLAQEKDWVLVAGKGHELTQTIGTHVAPFSDREQVMLALGLCTLESTEVSA